MCQHVVFSAHSCCHLSFKGPLPLMSPNFCGLCTPILEFESFSDQHLKYKHLLLDTICATYESYNKIHPSAVTL